MRKFVIAAVVLLILIGGAVFAVSRFNSFLESNREWLAQRASQALGREIRFDEIGVSLFPGVGAEVTDVVVGEDPAIGDEPFLQVDRAVVAVKILPALTGRYEVSRVILESPRVNVIRRAEGFNFESIGAPRGGATAQAPAGEQEEGGEGGPIPLLVSMLEINDGRVRFVDRTQSPPADLSIEQLDFSAADVGFDSAVDLDLKAAVLGFAEQNVSLSGSVGPLGSPQRAMQAPLDLEVRVGPVVIDRVKELPVVGESIPPELSSDDPITVEVDVGGTVREPRVVAALDGTGAGLRYGELFRKPAGTAFTVRAVVAQSADTIAVDDLALNLAGARIAGEGTIGTGSALPIDFRFSGNDIPLDGWGDLFAAAQDLDMQGRLDLDVRAQGPLTSGAPRLDGSISLRNVGATQPGGGVSISGLSTDVALRGDRVEIPPTQFQVAGQPVDLRATVTSLQDLAAEFSLSAARLPLAAIGAAGDGVASDEVVKDLAVEGTVQSQQGKPQARVIVRSSGGSVRGVDYADLKTEVGLAGERANLRQLSVAAFDGLITGNGSYTGAGTEPQFEFRGRVNGLSVGSILDYLGVSQVQMSGTVEGDLNLRGSGTGQEQIMSSLAGGGSLEVANGVLSGVNIAEAVLRSVTGVPGLSNLLGASVREKYPAIFAQSATTFDALRGQMSIHQGVADIEELLLAARDYRLRGKGTLTFQNVLDLAAEFIASADLARQLRSDVKELKYLLDSEGRLVIPVRLTGSLPDLRPQPNTEYLAKQLSGALVSQGIEKGLDSLLGTDEKEENAGPAAPAGEATPAAGQAAERLIRKGLEGLLGGGAE